VDDKAHHLTLLNVVKSHNTNVAVGVFRAALLHLVEYLLGAGAVEQGQLPHGPVADFSIRAFVELDAGVVALLNGGQ